MHVEPLQHRSRPNRWIIHPHAHPHLSHVFLITRGGGAMHTEDRTLEFASPSMLIIPARTAHGFKWHWESRGVVLTLADAYLKDLASRDPYLDELMRLPRIIEPSTEDVAALTLSLEVLSKELSRVMRGYRAAVDSAVLSIAVLALRRAEILDEARSITPGHQAALVTRLRERIESRYHLREGVADFAKALGASPTALRVACARVAGMAPAALLDQRALTEAKRALLYSNRSVAEVGYYLGFSDPAYFSRWFRRHVGRSPRRYRIQRGL